MSIRCLALSLTLLGLAVTGSSAHEPENSQQYLELDEAAVGSVRFATSCAAEIEPLFNRGIALLHSFWFAAAISTFDEVLNTDPECVMAEWGKAMAHWGNPLGNNRGKDLLKLGAEAVERARAMPGGTAREREYVEAVATLYKDFENTPDKSRSKAFDKAMEKLVSHYPDDSEAAIFFAMALNGSADLTDKSYAQPLRAAKILEAAFEAEPNHPGIAHYIIHSYDVPSLAMHALPAAQQYAGIAPAAPHALHMPSHTFTRLGYWQESIDTNQRSAKAAMAADSPAEALHAIDYMVYAYLQTAQDKAAAVEVSRSAEIFEQVADQDRYRVAGAFAAAAVPTRYALERGDWNAATKIATVESSVPFINAMVHLAHGVGAARSGDVATASAALAELKAAEEKLSKNVYWAGRVKIQRKVVEGWTLFAAGDQDSALKVMKQARDLERGSEKSAISPGPIAPAREQVGELLLAMNRADDALHAFEEAIEKEAGRFRGLFGAGVAADAAGKPDKAREYFSRLLKICDNGDGDREELRHASVYLKQVLN